jgi:hypothetical protein
MEDNYYVIHNGSLNDTSCMQKIPVIIFHLGNQEYVKLCLQQLNKYDNSFILLTDNDHFDEFKNDNCSIVNYKDYLVNAEKINYKHFSSNNCQFEFLCIIRWMCVYEYMKTNNINRAFVCDSDVLIYENITTINNKYLKDYDFMLCSSGSKNITGGQSIWNFEKIEEFVNFIFKFYSIENLHKMENWWKNYKEPGGICDMTLLYYFANNSSDFVGLRLPDVPFFNKDLTQTFDNEITFDLHLAAHGNHLYPDEYEINESNKNKNIKFVNKQPYCYNKRLQKNIKFILLHFQGPNKAIMKDFFNNS